MIPTNFITEWAQVVSWPLPVQIEQDLIICRAIVELYSEPDFQKSFAFRGGTALHKIHLQGGMRYSEDIDLVQTFK